MRLWTVVPEDFVEAVLITGRVRAVWDRVQGNHRQSFRWMVERMRERGVMGTSCGDVPPIWAWHSVGTWQGPPTLVTIDYLIGLEQPNREDLCLLTLEVAPERALLSRYAQWCDLLFGAISGADPTATPPDEILCAAWDGPGEPPWWDPYNDVQACLESVYRHDLVAVQPLAIAPGAIDDVWRLMPVVAADARVGAATATLARKVAALQAPFEGWHTAACARTVDDHAVLASLHQLHEASQACHQAWATFQDSADDGGRQQLRDVVETLLVQAWLVVTGPWPPAARWP